MKRFLKTISLVVFVIGLIFSINFFLFFNTPARKTDQPVSVLIEPGTGLHEITRKLSDEGLISNQIFFELYLKLRGFDTRIRAGDYQFAPGLSPNEIVDLLLKGDFARLRITLVEGWTVRDAARYLGEKGLAGSDEFLQKAREPVLLQSLGIQAPTLEGYLFPDTYEMYRPKGAEEIIRKVVGHFHEVFDETLKRRAQEAGSDVSQVLILASIVEKETGKDEERPLIASVFLNRLKRKMGLDSDPTVIYGIPNFNGNLTRADLKRPSPYNTYLNAGLPPTPIC
ncbi:MAG: endolytic transglycosylase MltG, partial [Deltaproteobacteria bacterium]|nr:endolytic transglycosylase MltG [Deltaproteobacteria bacterium]